MKHFPEHVEQGFLALDEIHVSDDALGERLVVVNSQFITAVNWAREGGAWSLMGTNFTCNSSEKWS